MHLNVLFILFQIFFDDLLIALEKSAYGIKVHGVNVTCPSYADDVTIVSGSRNGLQKMLEIAYEYSCKWKFKFNPEKCVTLTFNSGKRKSQVVKMGEKDLKEVESTNYLGTILSTKAHLEKENIVNRIQEAYKRTWLIKAIKLGVPQFKLIL